MKRYKDLNYKLIIVLLLLVTTTCGDPVSSQEKSSNQFPKASEVVVEMGSGVNLGNVFENGYQNIEFYELAAFISTYERAGMKHIRIPTTWVDGVQGSSLADENGDVNFNHPRFAILKQVIDFAIDKGLYVVLNTHHERTFKANYDGSQFYNDQITNLWTNIATYFKDYDHHLIFEILNEPEGAFGHWGTDVLPNSDQALLFTRGVMTLGVEAIRATGGNNLQRTVMIATNAYGNHNQIFSVYPNKASLPGGGSDEYLSIQVHSYDPWEFCGENGANDAYPGDVSTANKMRLVAEHGRMLGVPINYGEFGVGRQVNQADRNTDLVRDYYKTVVQTALEEGMSSTVWDDRGWFGLVEGDGNAGFTFKYGIVPYMLEQ